MLPIERPESTGVGELFHWTGPENTALGRCIWWRLSLVYIYVTRSENNNYYTFSSKSRLWL